MDPSVGPSPVADDNGPAPNSTGCQFQQNWNQNVNNTSDYTIVPNTDIWGNSLDTRYQGPIVRSNVGGANRIPNDLGSNVTPAATNAANDAARRIRIGAVMNGRSLPNVVIFGIGFRQRCTAGKSRL